MNKILSQALKKAVSEYSPEVKDVSKNNRPDLFSLNNETELYQNDKGIIIKIDRSRDVNLTENEKKVRTEVKNATDKGAVPKLFTRTIKSALKRNYFNK